MVGADSANAQTACIPAGKLLANNDDCSFFEGLSDLLVPGPTRTNVNDFPAIPVL
jgi:glycerate 2-kinase